MRMFIRVWIPFCILLMAAGCSITQKVVEQAIPVKPAASETSLPTPTPGPKDIGHGELELNYLHTLNGSVFKTTHKHFGFEIIWNPDRSVWEVISNLWVSQGEASLNTNGLQCNGAYIADLEMTSGVIVPPNPLKVLGDCKLVAQFKHQYDAFPFKCDNGISFTNEATTAFVGPITFDLRIGSRQHASGEPGDQWTSIYEYVITKLSLPPSYLLPYCDTTGVIDSSTREPPNPLDKVLTPARKP